MTVLRGPASWWPPPTNRTTVNSFEGQVHTALKRKAGDLFRLMRAMNKNQKPYWSGEWRWLTLDEALAQYGPKRRKRRKPKQ